MLYTSGILGAGAPLSGRLPPDAILVRKPYRRAELLERVGRAMEERAGSGGDAAGHPGRQGVE